MFLYMLDGLLQMYQSNSDAPPRIGLKWPTKENYPQ